MFSDYELLPLNDTRIVFIHPDDSTRKGPCAAQISVKPQKEQWVLYCLAGTTADTAPAGERALIY